MQYEDGPAWVRTGPLPTPTPQPRVAPESISWCIGADTLEAYNNRGLIMLKAHIVETTIDAYGRHYHRPICGAFALHLEDQCNPAPEGWPACRHCSRHQNLGVPLVFYGLKDG